MKISDSGINLIKQFEGFRSYPYKAVPSEKYYTIGYGHYGADSASIGFITEEAATNLLLEDLIKYEARVNAYDSVYYFTQNEFDALVSFCYNIGSITQLTANGTRSRGVIYNKMALYNKAGGNVLKGLVNRRNIERNLFISYPDDIKDAVRGVLNGQYGNGLARKNALTDKGYKYEQIQALVNMYLIDKVKFL